MPPRVPGQKSRYIAFRIDGDEPFARGDFLSALLHESRGTALDDLFRITVFEGNFGILKVPHRLKDSAIEVLSSVTSVKGAPCRVVTLKTSGTIKTLKEKFREFIGTGEDRS
jgi:RNase P/RNase MRP subunit POP5